MADHLVARPGKDTVDITLVAVRRFTRWLKEQNKATQNWLKSTGFRGTAGQVALLPDRNGNLARVVLVAEDTHSPWSFSTLVERLPVGRFAFDSSLDEADASAAALGFTLATYRFSRYKTAKKRFPSLVWPKGADRALVTRMAEAAVLGRDLVNTPAEDLGPAQLAEAGVELAKRHGGKATVLRGDALLKNNYPAVHAVGRAADAKPHLLDFTWGDPKAPKLTLVGKGVTFDSGGLDLKGAAGMRLMKKDMGGAASVLALAHTVMSAKLPVRLRVLIPAVENAVSGNAYRPGDVLQTRAGLTVEVGNTDAEGRLVLCDALAEAGSESPDLVIDFATLTGAARVALGTELPAIFSNDDDFAADVLAAGITHHDPLWRLPLHTPYRRHLDSHIADLNNISSVGPGGAITAALFLKEFIGKRTRWVHVDTMGYNASSRPGRPVGGEVLGIRAFYHALCKRYASPEQD